ncbi:MAG: hypothetical protein RLZZ367_1024, partial [Bacteroidota bacterium]|jgi:hypothetical protein
MADLYKTEGQICYVTNFSDLASVPYTGNINAICWNRKLTGNFSEIVNKIQLKENIVEIEPEQLCKLDLSASGQLAREIILNDWRLLEAHGASPVLNVIRHYDTDETDTFFPTDVYSFHVDRSPIATDTFLCTYYGEPSEILPNSQSELKVLIPKIRSGLMELYCGNEDGFEAFLSENFFDLHYEAKPGAVPISLGVGSMWRLAVDHPESKVPACVHRAPREKAGVHRLLMIC